METLIVKDLDSAVEALIALYSTDVDYEIEFSDSINVALKFNGEQWDGTIDYKMAQFIVDLQKRIFENYKILTNKRNVRFSDSFIIDNCLKIKVEIKEGCTEFLALLKEGFSKMESKHIAIVLCVGIISFFSANIASDFISMKKKEIEARIQEIEVTAEKEKVKAAIDSSFKFGTEVQNNFVELVRVMKSNDTLEINGKLLSNNEVKNIYRHIPKEPIEKEIAQGYKVDGDYIITEIDRERNTCKVIIGERKRRMTLEFLSDEDLSALYIELSKDKLKTPLSPISLQINVELLDGEYQTGAIVGIGKKREQAISYAEAFMDSVGETTEEE